MITKEILLKCSQDSSYFSIQMPNYLSSFPVFPQNKFDI
jgi:hypothetical protein